MRFYSPSWCMFIQVPLYCIRPMEQLEPKRSEMKNNVSPIAHKKEKLIILAPKVRSSVIIPHDVPCDIVRLTSTFLAVNRNPHFLFLVCLQVISQNGPFPSSCLPKCEVFHMKIIFHSYVK